MGLRELFKRKPKIHEDLDRLRKGIEINSVGSTAILELMSMTSCISVSSASRFLGITRESVLSDAKEAMGLDSNIKILDEKDESYLTNDSLKEKTPSLPPPPMDLPAPIAPAKPFPAKIDPLPKSNDKEGDDHDAHIDAVLKKTIEANDELPEKDVASSPEGSEVEKIKPSLKEIVHKTDFSFLLKKVSDDHSALVLGHHKIVSLADLLLKIDSVDEEEFDKQIRGWNNPIEQWMRRSVGIPSEIVDHFYELRTKKEVKEEIKNMFLEYLVHSVDPDASDDQTRVLTEKLVEALKAISSTLNKGKYAVLLGELLFKNGPVDQEDVQVVLEEPKEKLSLSETAVEIVEEPSEEGVPEKVVDVPQEPSTEVVQEKAELPDEESIRKEAAEMQKIFSETPVQQPIDTSETEEMEKLLYGEAAEIPVEEPKPVVQTEKVVDVPQEPSTELIPEKTEPSVEEKSQEEPSEISDVISEKVEAPVENDDVERIILEQLRTQIDSHVKELNKIKITRLAEDFGQEESVIISLVNDCPDLIIEDGWACQKSEKKEDSSKSVSDLPKEFSKEEKAHILKEDHELIIQKRDHLRDHAKNLAERIKSSNCFSDKEKKEHLKHLEKLSKLDQKEIEKDLKEEEKLLKKGKEPISDFHKHIQSEVEKISNFESELEELAQSNKPVVESNSAEKKLEMVKKVVGEEDKRKQITSRVKEDFPDFPMDIQSRTKLLTTLMREHTRKDNEFTQSDILLSVRSMFPEVPTERIAEIVGLLKHLTSPDEISRNGYLRVKNKKEGKNYFEYIF